MKTAIIGYTGFVGGNLCSQFEFDDFYNSKNIEDISGKHYRLLVCSGLPAAKWLANKDPQADLANTERLLGYLRKVKAEKIILISTVDVYPNPNDADENTQIDINKCQPYGKHRLMLEKELEKCFNDIHIIRLPGLFGKGLKKNAIYDFINNNQTEKIHADAVFQFYNLDHLWRDVQIAVENKLKLVNFATEPTSISEITEYAFDFEFNNRPDYLPPYYNFKSLYCDKYDGKNGYLYPKMQVLDEIKLFVKTNNN